MAPATPGGLSRFVNSASQAPCDLLGNIFQPERVPSVSIIEGSDATDAETRCHGTEAAIVGDRNEDGQIDNVAAGHS